MNIWRGILIAMGNLLVALAALLIVLHVMAGMGLLVVLDAMLLILAAGVYAASHPRYSSPELRGGVGIGILLLIPLLMVVAAAVAGVVMKVMGGTTTMVWLVVRLAMAGYIVLAACSVFALHYLGKQYGRPRRKLARSGA